MKRIVVIAVIPIVVLVASVGFVIVGLLSLLGGIFGSSSTSNPTSATFSNPPQTIIALDEAVSLAPPSLVSCHVPAALLLAQQEVESGYNPTALSPAGAVGLAQFEPSTFPTYALPVPPGGVTPPTPLDPVDAAYAEARMLCANGVNTNPTAALIIYNCGSISPACISASSGYASEIESLTITITKMLSKTSTTVALNKKGSSNAS